MGRFWGKTFLVTGASSGIGRAVSQNIASHGGRVVLIARDIKRLEETLKTMEAISSSDHLVISYDLSDLDHYRDIFDRLKKENIRLDGLVHCAGFTEILPLRIMNRNNALKLFDIHYFAFIEFVKFYAQKGVSNGGSIVGISAINAHTPQKCMTAYAAAKSAVESACKSLALELSEKNIRINSVIVGGVANTAMSEKAGEVIASVGNAAMLEKAGEVIASVGNAAMPEKAGGVNASVGTSYENPVKRQLLGVEQPQQIADVISFLLSQESSCITGRALYADAGLL